MILRTLETNSNSIYGKTGVLGKSFKNIGRDYSSGHSLFTSLFSGQSVTENDIANIQAMAAAMKSGATTAQAWRQNMKGCTVAAKEQAKQCLLNKGSLTELANGLQSATIKAKAAELGLKALSVAGNMLLSLGISMAISAVIKGVDYLIHKQEKLKEKLEETQGEYDEAKQNLDDVNKQIEEYGKRIDELEGKNLTPVEENELSRLKSVNKQLEIEKKTLEEIEKLKKGETSKAAIKSINSKKNGMTRMEMIEDYAHKGYVGTQNEIDRIISADYYTDEEKAYELKYLREHQDSLRTEALELSEELLEEAKALDLADSEAKSLYDQIQELSSKTLEWASDATVATNNVADSATTTADAVDSVSTELKDLEAASDNIGKISAAYKELNDDGYLTIKTINELKEATGLSGDEWTAYETKLLNAKKGSAEFNQIMSEMTYKIIENNISIGDLTDATEDEIAAIEKKIAATLRENGVTNASAVAHDYVTRVKEAARIKSALLIGATYDEVIALATEAQQAGITGQAFTDLVVDIGILNNKSLDVSQKIQALQELGFYANWTAQQIANIGSVKRFSADGKSGVGAYDKDGNLVGIELYDDYTTPEYKTPVVPHYSPSGSGSKSSGSSDSDKNDALDNYLEEAEQRYKIHQDEAKYINELDYALFNLVKTEEERQDVLDKIEQARKDYADNQVKDLEHLIEMTQNLKGENADVLEYYEKIKEVAHNEADRLRSIGYDDNSDEIQEWQNKWWDAQDKKMDFYSKQHDDIISDIEHARDIALGKNPYVDTTSYYKQMQDEYHKLAELYRSIDSEKYKKEIQDLQQSWQDAQQSIVDWRWENSQNWINQRNAYNDWSLFNDSEVKAWERVVDWLKTEYPEALDKIRDAEQSLYEARKNEFSKATDLTSSYLDSQKTLLQSYYDVTNSVAEAQHEITKELEASKTMYEYLNEDTRKLLFNQEDYNELSEELYDIQYKADKLQRQYQYDLENATLDTIEEITSNYEMQYETLMKSYEIAKAELEVAKKRQQLDNVLNERNVRMFINGQWQWVANTQDVINAQNELADAEYERKTAEAEARQTDSINSLTRQTNELSSVINKFESGVITLDEAINYVVTELGNLPNAIYSALSSASGSSKSKSSSSGAANATAWMPGLGTTKVYVDSNGKTQTNLPVGSIVTTNGGKYKITGGTAGNYTSIRVDDKYASGSNNTRAGNILVGEDEPEILVTKYGSLIPVEQPTLFKDMQSGGMVFNGIQMQNLRSLWDLSNMSIPSHSGIANKNQPSVVNNDNSYHVYLQGVEIDNGVIDINKLKRYVGNH